MISILSNRITDFFCRKSIIQQEDNKSYSYGFELLLSTLINLILILSLAVVFNVFVECWFYIAGFILLRATAGGYHAKHHWSCISMTSISYGLSAIGLKLVPSAILTGGSILLCFFSSLTVWILSPVEAPNKPLSQEKRQRMRNWSIAIASFNLVVALVSTPVLAFMGVAIAHYMTGATVASISMLIAVRKLKTQT